MPRAQPSRRPARSASTTKKAKAIRATLDDYRALEALAAQATAGARAEPSPNAYRAAAANHRAAARMAEDANLAAYGAGHDLAAQELDETAETLAATRRAEFLRSGPDLEADVRAILAEDSRRPRARR
jgi:hypothetical protein